MVIESSTMRILIDAMVLSFYSFSINIVFSHFLYCLLSVLKCNFITTLYIGKKTICH